MRKQVEQNRASVAVVRQVIATINRYAPIDARFVQYEATITHAKSTGHSKKLVSTLETRSPAISLPHKICSGVIMIVLLHWTHYGAAKRAARLLQVNNIPILGCLLVGRDAPGSRYAYGYGYGYGYGYRYNQYRYSDYLKPESEEAASK